VVGGIYLTCPALDASNFGIVDPVSLRLSRALESGDPLYRIMCEREAHRNPHGWRGTMHVDGPSKVCF
jgi:hypothetical protein